MAGVDKIIRQEKVHKVWQKVDNSGDGCPGFVNRTMDLDPRVLASEEMIVMRTSSGVRSTRYTPNVWRF